MIQRKMRQGTAAAALLVLIPFAAAADEITYTYNVAGDSCRILAMPAPNIPVHVMGQYTATNDSGMADLTMEWNSVDRVLQWMGIDYASNAIIRDKSALTDAHIAYLDTTFGGVTLEVQNASHFKVCNAFTGASVHGTITLIW